jgi:predicted small lipoprotein YifL
MKQNRILAALLAAAALCALTACGRTAVSNAAKGAASAQDSAEAQSSSNEAGLAGAKEFAQKLLQNDPNDPKQFILDTTNLNEVCDAVRLTELLKDASERKSESDLLDAIYAQIGLDEKGIAAYKQNAAANGQTAQLGRVEENPALCEQYKSWLNKGWLEFEDAFLDGELTREQVDQLKRDYCKPDHLYVAEVSDVTSSGSRVTVNTYISQVGERYYFDYFIEDDTRDVFREVTSYQVAAGDAWSTEG